MRSEAVAQVAATCLLPLMHGGAPHDKLNDLAIQKAVELLTLAEIACAEDHEPEDEATQA
jgi:hypothetical protein